MVRITPGLFLLAGLVLASPQARAAEGAVPRPEVREGDRWTYRRMDYAGGRSTGEYELRVTFAGAPPCPRLSTGMAARAATPARSW